MIRKFLCLAALLSLAALALGFMGRWHPLGDSLAVFRLPNLLVSAALIFAFSRRSFVLYGIGFVIFTALSMAPYYQSQKIEPEKVLKLYQKNMLLDGKNKAALKDDILQAKPDFISFQELQFKDTSPKYNDTISAISLHYPHQQNCYFTQVGGVAILSHWPILDTYCYKHVGIGAIKTQTPQGPIWVISVHLTWPYPYKQSHQVKRILDDIKKLEGPKIIAGDFNMVPWSHSVKSIERATDTHIARPIIHSFDLPIIGLNIPIDHVLLPKGAKAKTERRGKLGSDHYGVLVSFTLPEP